jgi:DNA-binding MarR family transcriptional regulator
MTNDRDIVGYSNGYTKQRKVTTMSTTPTFSTQLLGQTEKAASAILHRLLVEPGLTEPQWVTLAITAMSAGALDHGQLADRVATTLKVSRPNAEARVAELATARLLRIPEDDQAAVKLTDSGEELYAQTRAATMQVTQRLWGDLPAQDLATAGRVLSIVLARANTELAKV